MNSQPNSQLDVANFSNGVQNVMDNLSKTNMMTLIGGNLGSPGQTLRNRMTLLSSMTDGLNPVLKGLSKDMLSVLVSWLDDPTVLCCLIQGIWSAYLASNKDITKLIKDSNGELSLANTDFNKFLDMLVAFIDFIIVFLTGDVKQFVFMVPDFIKELMNGIMGAILLVIQEVAFALRDTVLSSIFSWMDKWDTDKTWSKCLPISQMISVLKKYIQDYGLLAGLLEKIKGYTCGLAFDFKKDAELLPKVQDLQFLYWLRDLLLKLKQSVINFDFCVDFDYNTNNNTSTPNSDQSASAATLDKLSSPLADTTTDPSKYQGYTTTANGTILIDKSKASENVLPRVSNSFIRDFVHDQYGIPYQVIDNTITRSTPADSIQGSQVNSTDTNLLDRCANTPASKEILKWILNLQG